MIILMILVNTFIVIPMMLIGKKIEDFQEKREERKRLGK